MFDFRLQKSERCGQSGIVYSKLSWQFRKNKLKQFVQVSQPNLRIFQCFVCICVCVGVMWTLPGRVVFDLKHCFPSRFYWFVVRPKIDSSRKVIVQSPWDISIKIETRSALILHTRNESDNNFEWVISCLIFDVVVVCSVFMGAVRVVI